MKYLTLLFILMLLLQNLDAYLLKSKASLIPLRSISSIPHETLQNPAISGLVAYSAYSGSFSSHFVGNCYVNGYYHATAPPYPNTLSFLLMHDANNFDIVDRLYSEPGSSTQSVSVSPNEDRPWIARTKRVGQSYEMHLYAYDPVGCTVEDTPRLVLDMADVHSDVYTYNLTYNGPVGFSEDGKYLFYVVTVDGGENMIYGIWEISADGLSATTVAEIYAPLPVEGTGVLYAQPDVRMRYYKRGKTVKYNIIVAADYIDMGSFSTPEFDSRLLSYAFYPENGTLVETGNLPSPNFIQGYDLSPDGKFVITYTNEIGEVGNIDKQTPLGPYPNNSPDELNELRLYEFDDRADHDALQYIDSMDTQRTGSAVRWSHDGKYVAVTSMSVAIQQIPVFVLNGAPVQTPGFGLALGPGLLEILQFNRGRKTLELMDSKPVAPSSLNIAWDFNDERIAVVGQPTRDQTDILFFEVESTN